jgi:hypothetical protein
MRQDSVGANAQVLEEGTHVTGSPGRGPRGEAVQEARYPNNFRHSSLKKLSKTGI